MLRTYLNLKLKLKLRQTNEPKLLKLHLLDMFGALLGIQKPVKFDPQFVTGFAAPFPRKQNIQYFVSTLVLTSKACPEIEEDSY